MLYTALYMAATRTQVYLTEEQRQQIEELRARDGRTLAEVIRAALDDYLATHGRAAAERDLAERRRILDETFGSMRDFPYPDRSDWDRGYG
jgi:Arc/MetJ-type ribon-helix-helix transcriptional regulator